MKLDPLADRFRGFGYSATEVDGHDVDALIDAFHLLPLVEPAKPTCLVANTYKGKGVSFIEDRAEWHHRVPVPRHSWQGLQGTIVAFRIDDADGISLRDELLGQQAGGPGLS